MRKPTKKFLTRFDHLEDKPENIWIFDEDVELFQKMKGNYQTEAEREFFEKLQWKIYHQFAPTGDYLVSEFENEDHIFWIKQYHTEHEVGRREDLNDGQWHKAHFDSLSDLLNANMREAIGYDRDITFWQWLREQDYKCINYNRVWED